MHAHYAESTEATHGFPPASRGKYIVASKITPSGDKCKPSACNQSHRILAERVSSCPGTQRPPSHPSVRGRVPEIAPYLFPRKLSLVLPSGPGTQCGFYLPCLPVMLTHDRYEQCGPSLRETGDDKQVTMSLSGG